MTRHRYIRSIGPTPPPALPFLTAVDGGINMVLSGGVLANWNDSTANGNSYMQATPTLRPTIVTINNVPAAGFNGVDQVMNGPATNTVSGNVFTHFAVFHGAVLGADVNYYLAGAQPIVIASSGNIGLSIGATRIQAGFFGALNRQVNDTMSSADLLARNVARLQYDGATLTLQVNDRPAVTLATTDTPGGGGILNMGAVPGGATLFNGRIGFVGFSNISMSPAQLRKVYQYINNRYAVPVPPF